MKQPPLKLTAELIPLIRAVLHAKAWVATVHPIVTGYQKAILEELQATDAETGAPVTDSELTYRMSEEQFARYRVRCDEEAARNNLTHKPDCCPLLEAESMERDAVRYFCQGVLPLLPGYEKVQYEDLCKFAKDEKGEDKRDKFGRFLFLKDTVAGLALQLLVPQLSEADLKDIGQITN